MRTSVGCHACRDRHLKCTTQPGEDKCKRCITSGRECRRGLTIRFRPVTSVREKRAEAGKLDHVQLDYRKDQVWVETPSVTFIQPASTLEDLEDETFKTLDGDSRGLMKQPPVRPFNNRPSIPGDSPSHGAGPASRTPTISSNHVELGAHFEVLRRQDNASAASGSDGVRAHQEISHDTPSIHSTSPANVWSPVSILYQPSPIWTIRTEDEARLFQYYVQFLGPHVDCCDENGHFGTEVPRRAMSYPVIANAILALTSRVLNGAHGTEDLQSASYMSECLRILIPVLEDPLAALDENLLAAIVILRLYEEMDDRDQKTHLYGGTRLINSIAHMLPRGGLGEAAAWIFIRQDLYVSLTTGEPVNCNLEIYRKSHVFEEESDCAWANRIIYIFAHVLNYCSQQNQSEENSSIERWKQLGDEVEAWNTNKPHHFRPLWVNEPKETGSPFPEIWMTLPAHVVGQQYYSLAKILLASYDPHLLRLGFGSHKLRKISEGIILSNLRIVVGLAITNPFASSAMNHASHILLTCGSYFEDERDRECAVEFLEDMERKIGWRTERVISVLREQWKA
ncbi:hypothetical protein IWZ00DRAFT_368909 [Phyllosticta capitalensis]|uniref:Zn(2)-C6 fungal-type domain-containing protein n=1 Tax=Phyllosticta capitalensis TaxID=121624 RepID=A0ABR1YDU1_9PEZI